MTHVYGEEQPNQAPFSSEHWKVRPLSPEVQAKPFVALLVGSVGLVVRVGAAGATESDVHANLVALLVFPAASTATTAKVCDPCPRPAYDVGLVQVAYAALSRLHRYVTPVSVSVKENDGLVDREGLVGVAVSCGAAGGVTSMVQVHDVTALSSAPLTAFTPNVWVPAVRPAYDVGLEQAAYAAVSSWHLNDAPDGPEKARVALVEEVAAPGAEVIVGAAREDLESATVVTVSSSADAEMSTASSIRTLVLRLFELLMPAPATGSGTTCSDLAVVGRLEGATPPGVDQVSCS